MGGGPGAFTARRQRTAAGCHLGKDCAARGAPRTKGAAGLGLPKLSMPCVPIPVGQGGRRSCLAPQPSVEPHGSAHSWLPQPRCGHRKVISVLGIPGVFLRRVAPREMKDGQIAPLLSFHP